MSCFFVQLLLFILLYYIQAENVTREHLLEGIKVLLIGLLFAVLPSDILGFLGYSFSSGVANTVLHYPYSRLLETEADEVGLHLAAKVHTIY